MTIPDEVHIVTSGEYSDYHIVRVFSKKDDAEEYAAARNRSTAADFRVEAWPVDSATRALHEQWFAEVRADGYTRTSLMVEEDGIKEHGRNYDYSSTSAGFGYAATEEKALKIARDELAKLQAQAAGLM